MFKLGIIDPTKVAKTALQNAASVAGLALTTDVMITELKEKKGEKEPHPVAGAVGSGRPSLKLESQAAKTRRM